MLDDIPKPSDPTIIKLKGKYSPDTEHLGFTSLLNLLQMFPNNDLFSTMSGVPLLDGKITRNGDTDFVPSGNYNQYLVADPSQVFCVLLLVTRISFILIRYA